MYCSVFKKDGIEMIRGVSQFDRSNQRQDENVILSNILKTKIGVV
jgi:hypothetical protein